MAQIIGLPKLSPTMEEGVLVRWTKKEGDKVSPGDLVAEVETDKANMDFNIEDEGVLLKFLVKEGDTVKLGAPVAIIGKAGEDIAALLEQAKSAGGAPAAAPAKPAAPAARGAEDSANAPAAQKPPREATRPEQDQAGKAAVKPAPAARPGSPPVGTVQPAPTKGASAKPGQPAQTARPSASRLLASPLAKTLAIELGIDLRQVTGTGPGGRIVERDVRAAAEGGQHNGHGAAAAETSETGEAGEAAETGEAEPAAAPAAASQALAVRPARPAAEDTEADWTDTAASNMRKRIAQRMTEAKRDVPHIYLMRELDAAPLLAYRERLNQLVGDKVKISVNDLIVKAVALALRRMPECNASWQGDAIRQFHRVHIGVAVAIPEGLVTPVVRDADAKGIGSIAAEIKDLADRARKRALKVHEIQGSTFSVSNLGMFGIERFTAIINPPEAGILAVGAARDVAVVDKGNVVAGKRITVSMSCDHRVIDGALGARWLTVLAELIEKPESLAL
ncbi:MAG TPA: pyruvate dehydrogenase complex dihydrolipoamide acetyltransferase [Kofleriaceae bacterium]|jgi:pyruvate dehydrogenase E2 component (dihydrolipoamide acetyltransferase)|nr:pyruvate dehydrogenase complex dihydrolipoamide acetyltransferase [Kofleriaceae bacterium]